MVKVGMTWRLDPMDRIGGIQTNSIPAKITFAPQVFRSACAI
jgi:hypothetical protein